jgi:hypothetical protein
MPVKSKDNVSFKDKVAFLQDHETYSSHDTGYCTLFSYDVRIYNIIPHDLQSQAYAIIASDDFNDYWRTEFSLPDNVEFVGRSGGQAVLTDVSCLLGRMSKSEINLAYDAVKRFDTSMEILREEFIDFITTHEVEQVTVMKPVVRYKIVEKNEKGKK